MNSFQINPFLNENFTKMKKIVKNSFNYKGIHFSLRVYLKLEF